MHLTLGLAMNKCLCSGLRKYAIIGTLIAFSVASHANAQQLTQPKFGLPASPVGGWDTFKPRFPELALRAGLSGAYNVNVTIDSLGNAVRLSISRLDNPLQPIDSIQDIFYRTISSSIRGTRWISNASCGKSVECTITIPIIFVAREFNAALPIVVSGIIPPTMHGDGVYRGPPLLDSLSPNGLLIATVTRYHPAKSSNYCKMYLRGDGGIVRYFDTTFWSPDPNKSLGIDDIGWSPDSRYFVFTISSHHRKSTTPYATYCFSMPARRLLNLTEVLGRSLSSAFRLASPDSLIVTVESKNDGLPSSVAIDLDGLFSPH